MRIPDGLFLAYPGQTKIIYLILYFDLALNLDLKEQFTPSVLLTLEDEIIPHSILKLCINSYINNENWDPKTDPFLSPIIASDEVFEF